MSYIPRSSSSANYRTGSKIPPPSTAAKVSTNNAKPLLSFELFDSGHECPSTWRSNEIKLLFQMFNKACKMTWIDILKTGGKNKTGLGYTELNHDPFTRPKTLSADLTISELRVTQKARVFGIRVDRTYYVLRLDRNHNVIKG